MRQQVEGDQVLRPDFDDEVRGVAWRKRTDCQHWNDFVLHRFCFVVGETWVKTTCWLDACSSGTSWFLSIFCCRHGVSPTDASVVLAQRLHFRLIDYSLRSLDRSETRVACRRCVPCRSLPSTVRSHDCCGSVFGVSRCDRPRGACSCDLGVETLRLGFSPPL